MPFDTSIYAQQRRLQMPNPLEQYGQALQIKNLMDQQETTGLQRQKLERDFAREGQLRDLVAASGGDRKMLIGNLVKGGFLDEAGKLEESDRKVRKDEADIQKTGVEQKKIDLEFRIKNFDIIDQNLNSATDQASYDVALERIKTRLGPDAMANIPPQFDPARIAAARQQSLPIKEQLEQQWKALDFNYRQGNDAANRGTTVTAQTETARHNRQTESQGSQRLDLDRTQPKGVIDTERGLLVDPRTGEARPVTMGGAPVGMKPVVTTESEKTSEGYHSRMVAAEAALTDIAAKTPGAQKPGLIEQATGGVGMIANLSRDADRQQYRQAQEDWVRAKLRKESGAVIGADEMDREITVYFPQIGDSKEVIAQKAKGRVTAIAGMRLNAGRAAQPPAAPQQQGPATPRTFDAMPDPAQYSGKRMQADDGTVYRSDGRKWLRDGASGATGRY